MSLIPYPNVPPLPGVPAINRNSAGYVGAALNVVGQLLPNNLFGTKWAILDKNGKSIMTPDNFIAFEIVRESKIPTYPVEQGSFSSYNKVRTPSQYKLTVSCGGRGKMSKENFLKVINDMMIGSNADKSPITVSIVTPEFIYENCCLVHTDSRREARNGATLLIYQLWFQEVIVVTQPAAPTAQPSGSPKESNGQVSPVTPTSAQASSAKPSAVNFGIYPSQTGSWD